MTVTDELLQNNQKYAATFDKGALPLPPAKQLAVVACMDARLDTHRLLGIAEGDAHVIRNAGGVVSEDTIRSLTISQRLLGTKEIVIIHHTDCGMETFTDEVMRGLLASSLETSTVDENGWRDHGAGPGSTESGYIDWLTISDNAQSVVADVRRIREHPLVPRRIPIYGYIYDCKSGRLNEVPEAATVGVLTHLLSGERDGRRPGCCANGGQYPLKDFVSNHVG